MTRNQRINKERKTIRDEIRQIPLAPANAGKIAALIVRHAVLGSERIEDQYDSHDNA